MPDPDKLFEDIDQVFIMQPMYHRPSISSTPDLLLLKILVELRWLSHGLKQHTPDGSEES